MSDHQLARAGRDARAETTCQPLWNSTRVIDPEVSDQIANADRITLRMLLKGGELAVVIVADGAGEQVVGLLHGLVEHVL
jgi:hypothetical protein